VSGLFSTLTSASRALEAQRFGLDVTGQNIANVNTPGYARREILLASAPPADAWSAGSGVDIQGVRAARDRLLERRLQLERPAEQREGAVADSLSIVEVAIGRPGESIDAHMDVFFSWAAQLSADPASATLRHEFVSAGERLAGAFSEMSDRLSTARRQADANVRSAVTEVNQLAAEIAALNANIVRSGSNTTGVTALRDQQRVVLDQLSGLMDVAVIERADGGIDVTTAGGRSLVIGHESHAITLESMPPEGLADLRYDGVAMASDVSGGRLGGYLHARDTLVPDYLARLDTLAAGLASEVNALHMTGFDNAGNLGGAFFTFQAGPGAAASLGVEAAIVADPGRVAAAGLPIAGDNQNARALAALRDARVLNGGTFSDAWAQMVYRVGSDAQAARQEQISRQEIVRQVEALNDAVSGVSLDEEAMMMLRFQRAYEANARFFQAVDQAIETLLTMVR
jgi:flagellar hook-associated protein 1 FlgK